MSRVYSNFYEWQAGTQVQLKQVLRSPEVLATEDGAPHNLSAALVSLPLSGVRDVGTGLQLTSSTCTPQTWSCLVAHREDQIHLLNSLTYVILSVDFPINVLWIG